MAQQSIQTLRSNYPWISIPLIVGAPMKSITGPTMAVAVSEANGLGFIGPTDRPEDLRQHLQKSEELISQSTIVKDVKLRVLPIGFGVQTWTGDLKTTSAILREWNKKKMHPPAAAWLFAPRHGQAELDEWSKEIRSASPQTQVWIQIASVADAVAAAASSERPDVIVVQGTDAGGHSLTKGAGIITLFPEVSNALCTLSPEAAQIPLIAAGGITESRSATAAFALGASGVAMGTRLLATPEAQVNAGYQQAVIDGWDGGQNTVRTQLYNQLRGTFGWPEAFDARGLVNQSWRDHENGMEFEENRALYAEAVKKGADGWGRESGRMATYAGTGVGLVKEVRGAADVVRDVRDGIKEVLTGLKDVV